MSSRTRLTGLGLAAAGGALTSTAFPDLNLWPAAPVGVAVLLAVVARASARWAALLGEVWGVALMLPVLWWADASVGAVPWVALSVACAGYVALFAAGWVWARRSRPLARRWWWLDAAVAGVLWVAAEELRARWPFGGFPWPDLSFSQTSGPLLPLAWLGGAPLLSGLVAALGSLLVSAVTAVRGRRWGASAGTALAVVAVLTVGLAVPLSPDAQSGTLRLGLVQGNTPGRGLDAFGRQWQVLDNHVAGTRALAAQVGQGTLDLVVWPENGSDVDPQVNTQAAGLIDGAARAAGAPLLVGTVQYPTTGGRYNTSVLWEPGVGVVAQYSKQRPAPFAEYVPLRSLVRPFSHAVDLVTQDMLPGHLPGYVPLESARLGRTVGLGTVICFEVAYDPLVRSAVTSGGEVILVQTNNASFGKTSESTQQLAMTRLRAVEFGRTAVQISTVGVSAVVLPDGTVTHRTGLFTAEQVAADVPLRTSMTPAARLGGWPVGVAGTLALLLVAAGGVEHGRRRRSHDRAPLSRKLEISA